ncbi:MAG: redoxin domain-containing protein, partial [Sphingobacteriales bacterium]
PNSTQSTLNDQLADFQQSWNAQAPAGLQQKFEHGIEEIKAINQTGLKAGDKAPDFELNNATGNPIKLTELLKNGPVVFSWYRGGWCPYCNIQ